MVGRASISDLDRREVLLCVGPGGVGKTTCAASLALSAAGSGRRVAVITVDPSRRLAQALGIEEESDDGDPVEVEGAGADGGSLHASVLHPRGVFDQIVRAYSRDPGASARILGNPIYRATVQHLGGALEYAAMARVHMLHDAGRWDLVVLDTPPTANAMAFLEAPGRIREIVSNPASRLLAGTGKLGMRLLGLGGGVVMKALESMGGGAFLRELGLFLRDFADVLGEFQRRAGDFDELMRSPETGVALITSATRLSVREGIEFLGVLRGQGLAVDGVALNRVATSLPPPPVVEDLEAALRAAGDPNAERHARGLMSLYAGVRHDAERGDQAVVEIAEAFPDLPVVRVPRRRTPPTTLDELREMGDMLLRPGDS